MSRFKPYTRFEIKENPKMDMMKEYSRRSLFWVVLVLGLMCVLVNAAFLYGIKYIAGALAGLSRVDAPLGEVNAFFVNLNAYANVLKTWFVPLTAVAFAFFIVVLWGGLRFSFKRFLAEFTPTMKQAARDKKAMEGPDPAEKQRGDQRMFLHLLGALQREGRLLDFFSEDLDQYGDEQIGAAVRSIQENCKKVLTKYVIPGAIVGTAEGEDYTVAPDFDPTAVKLTGNVTGDPPFEGVVRHRGWKVEKLNLPALSGAQDPDIIAPAEIEIA